MKPATPQRKRILAMVLGACLLSPASASSAEPNTIPDLAYFDGFAWNRIERISPEWAFTFKTFLVRGIYEGAYTVNPGKFVERFNNDTSYRELVNTLDKFYFDESNLKTPVTYAIMMLMKVPTKSIKTRAGNVLVSMEDSRA